MSCEECEHFRGKAFGFIGKETAAGGRKIDLYGGWVECAAPEIKKPCDAPNVADATRYKVGDWVEWCGDQYMVESAPPQSGGRYNIRSPYDELGCSVCPENITRKLSPSEVVIHIGCLSGTVINGTHSWFHLVGTNRKTIATIRISSLDTRTRELVESLLKAQEEEQNEKIQ